jgi:hypothetical protein
MENNFIKSRLAMKPADSQHSKMALALKLNFRYIRDILSQGKPAMHIFSKNIPGC